MLHCQVGRRMWFATCICKYMYKKDQHTHNDVFTKNAFFHLFLLCLVFIVFKFVILLKSYLFSVQLFLPSENSTLAEACCSVSVEFCIIGFKYIGNAQFLASANILIRQRSNKNIPCTDLVSWLRMITEAGQLVRRNNSVLQNKDLHPPIQSDLFFFSGKKCSDGL